MFSGIIEACVAISKADGSSQLMEITVEKPSDWSDLRAGDSIAVNGICLTLEEEFSSSLKFSLGPETLRITQWLPKAGEMVNLERSLRFGDRVHGHLVSGHVDGLGQIIAVHREASTVDFHIRAAKEFLPFIWRKGSVAVQGVSLTINSVEGDIFQVGLIPETLRRTNLASLKVGSQVHLEADALARAWFHWREKQ